MTDRAATPRFVPWPDSISRPLVSPIQPAAVYVAESPDMLDAQYEGRTSGYTYAREGHPNADVLARQIDALEGVEGGWICGSGMAAISAVLLGCLKSGDHVIGGDQLYGRTLRLMTDELPRFGIETSLGDTTDADAVAQALRPNTKMMVIEVVSNPTIRLADVVALAALTKERGITLVVDNTFTTPRSFRPADWGADIVVHSVTKILAGHSDATLGYFAARDPDLQTALIARSVTMGLTPSAFDCWLAERGLMSFPLRFDRSEQNAERLATALAEMPGVRRVLYPTRQDHPDHNRTGALLGQRGGHMLSFEIEGGRAAANRLTKAGATIAFAPTLGDIGTTLSHPASSSHRGLSAEGREKLGISEGFFRVSVGVEDPDALIAEFAHAVAASQSEV
ncbi:MAG: aminotransferase class I/II-fold pyridoxal phosphate-dependent enzyme [Pseudomonadota bacterium]